MKLRGINLLVLALLSACSPKTPNLFSLVDPLIGTDGHGHTFPGATTPFGMVQLSPDTGTEGWDWCSGYHYSDSSIMGFSHTHLSGTGGADLGDILLMPFTGEHKWEAGSKQNPDEGYRSRFTHQKESAHAGYYSVLLKDYNILAELTATPRTGIHKYSFNNNTAASIIIDLEHGIGDQPKEGFIQVNGNHEVVGMRRSQGWAADQYVYFVARFSKPFSNHTFMADNQVIDNHDRAEGKSVKLILDFENTLNEELLVKVGISAVDTEGAHKNLEAEAPHNKFDRYLKASTRLWNQQLGKIVADGGSDQQKRTFYTALYHTMIAPNLFTDVDGRYRGMDKEIHHANNNQEIYTIFSLWDTFRATHPLYTLIEPDKNRHFINTMLTQYQQHGLLPVWELMGNETGTMIGYHSVPVIWDAYQKGERGFDANLALEAMKKSAMMDHIGLADYKNLGFIPLDREGNSVSKTVEYAYDDWCIAQMAKALEKDQDYKTFIGRAQNYRNVFDLTTGFLRGRQANGNWREPFDPIESSILGSGDFTEGNSWHYTFFAPQDIAGLMELYGGPGALAQKIDDLFDQAPVRTNEQAHDISGLIGQYAHGNEPSHHVAYLYNYTGQPWKTQERVALIIDSLYTDRPDGLSGNEDCGQMSAWYVFSSMGFYPVTPGNGLYMIGAPLFEQATINLDNGKTFTVKTVGRTREAIYIQAATFNGQPFNRSWITHDEIMAGGELIFEMGQQPAKEWGSQEALRPVCNGIPLGDRLTPIEERMVFAPYTEETATLFTNNQTIKINCNTPGVAIHYTLNGQEPTQNDFLYSAPFTLQKTTMVKARAFKEGLTPSELLSREYIRARFNKTGSGYPAITLSIPASAPYNKAGGQALLNGLKGSRDFHDGQWLGFNKNFSGLVDLGTQVSVKQIRWSFLRNVGSWILIPEHIEILGSNNNRDFVSLGTLQNKTTPDDTDSKTIEFIVPVNEVYRYYRLKATSMPALPEWHPGAGNHPWIFTDEIIFEY